jgi:hypothetical protein
VTPRELFERWLAERPGAREAGYAEGAGVVAFVIEEGGVRRFGALALSGGDVAVGEIPEPAGGAPVAPAPPAGAELEPYRAWEPHAVPDPRSAGRDALMPVVMEIVAAEGPVLAGRAFGLYTRASGGKKLTGAAKAPLTGAAWRLKIQDRLVIAREGATTIDNDDVLRATGVPAVVVRELGPRTLEEVPPEEVAELMRRLRGAGATDLKRAVLDTYGLIRLTGRADEYLGRALEIAGG